MKASQTVNQSKPILMLLVLMGVLAGVANADRLATKSGYKSRNPLVEACEAQCVFQNDDNRWCYEVTPPVMQVGWVWNQTFTTLEEDPYTKYYQLEVLPYVDFQLYILQVFDVRRLIYNEFVLDLAKFRTNYFFSVIFNNATTICPGMGYETEAIDLEFTTTNQFQDCYKVIVDDLCDWSAQWTGFNAKYFDECDQSQDQEVILKNFAIKEATFDVPQIGTTAPESFLYCYDWPLINSSSAFLSGLSQHTANKLTSYFTRNFIEKK